MLIKVFNVCVSRKILINILYMEEEMKTPSIYRQVNLLLISKIVLLFLIFHVELQANDFSALSRRDRISLKFLYSKH